MVYVLGYDVGGANIKVAAVHLENGCLRSVAVVAEYFPVWKHPEKLAFILANLKERLKIEKFDAVGVTMTAELSDAYQTKSEGVYHILASVKKVFNKTPIFVLNTDATLITLKEAKLFPLKVASANWAGTGWLVAQFLKNAIVVDVGSTSTSIIPILNNEVAAQGKTDVDKLVCGELVYTGSLRTNIAAIVKNIPLKDGLARVSSELFAVSGDVHLVLGNIPDVDYTSETTDGRGKTVAESLARLARVVCADTDMLSVEEICEIANYIYREQIRQIADDLKKAYTYIKSLTQENVCVIVTGMGKEFLARRAAEQLVVDEIIDLDAILPKETVYATPAVAVALMTANKIAGGNIKWTSQF